MEDDHPVPENCILLERGLCFYFEHSDEFERRATPIEKQVAFAYEAGFQAGRAEINTKITIHAKPDLLRV